MIRTPVFAAVGLAAAVALSFVNSAFAQTQDPDYVFVTLKTATGCLYRRTKNQDTSNVFKPPRYSEPCTQGKYLSGKGTLTLDHPGERTHVLLTATFVDGYIDGPTIFFNEAAGYEMPDHYTMGCRDWDLENGCVPGIPDSAVAAAEPDPRAEPAGTDPATEEPAALEPPVVEQPTEPAEVSEEVEGVNEISEGEVPQQRWLEARRTKSNAPRHHADHDVSTCVGTFWKMHAGTGHYVIYNKCDKDIRVGWCSIGYGGDCVAGKGQIATMEPMVGYTGGLKREETPKYFACSKNIFPVYEGNELVAFSCD
ncbi:hypothetical protein sos41_31840 [Alphaproteobacteria bacterium SO-S41]|nr:hypothetical protein sos41_31840 [Alphaproteobacteria bacterium SO-S41]